MEGPDNPRARQLMEEIRAILEDLPKSRFFASNPNGYLPVNSVQEWTTSKKKTRGSDSQPIRVSP